MTQEEVDAVQDYIRVLEEHRKSADRWSLIWMSLTLFFLLLFVFQA